MKSIKSTRNIWLNFQKQKIFLVIFGQLNHIGLNLLIMKLVSDIKKFGQKEEVMIFVIDGFNLIYKFKELETLMLENNLEMAIEGLISYLASLKKKRGNFEFHIFFDGKKRKGDDTYQEKVEEIHCYYSHEISADSLIEDFIKTKKAKHFTNICVVSSDKKIIKITKNLRYEHKTSEEFSTMYYQIMNTKQKEVEKPESVSNKEINDWLRIFKNRK